MVFEQIMIYQIGNPKDQRLASKGLKKENSEEACNVRYYYMLVSLYHQSG